MKYAVWIFMGLIVYSVVGMITFNYVLDAEPLRKYNQLSQTTLNQADTPTKIVKVDGIEYLVVESRNGIGVCFAMTKNNFKRIAGMVEELEGELSAEKLNRILQNNK